MATWQVFAKAKLNLAKGNFNFDAAGDTLKVGIVVAGGGAPNTGDAGSGTWTEVKAANAEVTGTNYVADGVDVVNTLGGPSSGVVTLSGTNPTWTQHASGFNDGRYFVLHNGTYVIAYLDPGQTLDLTAGDIEVDLNSGGGEILDIS